MKNTLTILENVIYRLTGRTAEEIRQTPLSEIHQPFDPLYAGLNPKKPRDAKRISRRYETSHKQSIDFCEVFPHEVVEARLTLALL